MIDKRLSQFSYQRAPVDEVLKLVNFYRTNYFGWNTRHSHTWYAHDHNGQRSYTWVKNRLQEAGVVIRVKASGNHRKKRVTSMTEANDYLERGKFRASCSPTVKLWACSFEIEAKIRTPESAQSDLTSP